MPTEPRSRAAASCWTMDSLIQHGVYSSPTSRTISKESGKTAASEASADYTI